MRVERDLQNQVYVMRITDMELMMLPIGIRTKIPEYLFTKAITGLINNSIEEWNKVKNSCQE